jgi:chromosome segregation ATPase
MIGERARLNLEREEALRRGGSPGPMQFVPRTSEILQALQERDGRSMSLRDLTPLVRQYYQANKVFDRLPARARQKPPHDDATADASDLKGKLKAGVVQALAAIGKQQECLATLLHGAVLEQTTALRSMIASLEAEKAVLEHDLDDKEDILGKADELAEQMAVLEQALTDEKVQRHTAERRAVEAQEATVAARAERDAALEVVSSLEQDKKAVEDRRDELVSTLARVSADLERVRRLYEEAQRTS